MVTHLVGGADVGKGGAPAPPRMPHPCVAMTLLNQASRPVNANLKPESRAAHRETIHLSRTLKPGFSVMGIIPTKQSVLFSFLGVNPVCDFWCSGRA